MVYRSLKIICIGNISDRKQILSSMVFADICIYCSLVVSLLNLFLLNNTSNQCCSLQSSLLGTSYCEPNDHAVIRNMVWSTMFETQWIHYVNSYWIMVLNVVSREDVKWLLSVFSWKLVHSQQSKQVWGKNLVPGLCLFKLSFWMFWTDAIEIPDMLTTSLIVIHLFLRKILSFHPRACSSKASSNIMKVFLAFYPSLK